jgi:hypothetical protein
MGIPAHLLRDNVLSKMSPATRKAERTPTRSEIDTKQEIKFERELHDQFAQWCGTVTPAIRFVHAQMNRKSTIAEGHPDFTLLWKGKSVCVEFKVPGADLKPKQRERIADLLVSEVPVLVSSDLGEAIRWTQKHLLGKSLQTS